MMLPAEHVVGAGHALVGLLLADSGSGFGGVLIALGLLALGGTLGAGALRLARRRPAAAGAPVLPSTVLAAPPVPPALRSPFPSLGVEPAPAAAAPPPVSPPSTALPQVHAALLAWLGEQENGADLWGALDQVVRETLGEYLGATRVRCFRVQPESDSLQTIAQARSTAAPAGPGAREGILGHVVTSGREFVAHETAQGPLVQDLASESTDGWTWVWPIRSQGQTAGLVAVGHVHDPGRVTPEVRQTIGPLLTLCWHYVACREQLRIVGRTDQASGVLTRGDFFTLAGHALADSYGSNEPVVIAVLALEGLRRLDDRGCWRERDQAIEKLGNVIRQRIRSDDLVGRFADDRFVVLLRRLDSGLGRLIAQKMHGSAEACLAGLAAAGADGQPVEGLHARIGLAGSGLERPALAELLVAAFDAAERARRNEQDIATDLPGEAGAGPGADAARS